MDRSSCRAVSRAERPERRAPMRPNVAEIAGGISATLRTVIMPELQSEVARSHVRVILDLLSIMVREWEVGVLRLQRENAELETIFAELADRLNRLPPDAGQDLVALATELRSASRPDIPSPTTSAELIARNDALREKANKILVVCGDGERLPALAEHCQRLHQHLRSHADAEMVAPTDRPRAGPG